MLQSKYIAFFQNQVSTWQRKLSQADQVIQILREVQKTWAHLESIFIGTEDIRKQFGNPNMTRQEMLDALAFGSFEEHKKKSLRLMSEGKIPPFKMN